MFDKIIHYLEKKPLIGVVAIIVLLTVAIMIKRTCGVPPGEDHYRENFDTVPQPDAVFYKTFVGSNKLINFICTIGSKQYYLACVKVDGCLSSPPPAKPDPDCDGAALILIDKNDIDSNLKNYELDLQDGTDICNFKSKLACRRKNNVAHGVSSEECDSILSEDCVNKRMYIHDFIVNEIVQNGGFGLSIRKYLVNGTAIPMINGSSFTTLLSQHLYNNKGINYVCGDDFPYGANPKENLDGELYIDEKPVANTNQDIIDNSGAGIVVRLKFSTQGVMSAPDKDGNAHINKFWNQPGDVPRVRSSYMGFSPTKTCMFAGKSYQRVALYDNDNDPNIVYFEPVMVAH